MMTDQRITRLEEGFTHLQDHVAAQDKVILELRDALDRMRQEYAALRAAAQEAGTQEAGPADERPPHY